MAARGRVVRRGPARPRLAQKNGGRSAGGLRHDRPVVSLLAALKERCAHMALHTDLTRRLGLRHPIIQAPMAGGGDTPALVAAVSEAGALGCIGAAYLSPDQIRSVAREVRRMTSQPYGINLFAPAPPISGAPD